MWLAAPSTQETKHRRGTITSCGSERLFHGEPPHDDLTKGAVLPPIKAENSSVRQCTSSRQHRVLAGPFAETPEGGLCSLGASLGTKIGSEFSERHIHTVRKWTSWHAPSSLKKKKNQDLTIRNFMHNTLSMRGFSFMIYRKEAIKLWTGTQHTSSISYFTGG